jgi:hypothetical protein
MVKKRLHLSSKISTKIRFFSSKRFSLILILIVSCFPWLETNAREHLREKQTRETDELAIQHHCSACRIIFSFKTMICLPCKDFCWEKLPGSNKTLKGICWLMVVGSMVLSWRIFPYARKFPYLVWIFSVELLVARRITRWTLSELLSELCLTMSELCLNYIWTLSELLK